MRLQSPIHRRQGPPRLTSAGRALISLVCAVVAGVAWLWWAPDALLEAAIRLEQAVRVSAEAALAR